MFSEQQTIKMRLAIQGSHTFNTVIINFILTILFYLPDGQQRTERRT